MFPLTLSDQCYVECQEWPMDEIVPLECIQKNVLLTSNNWEEWSWRQENNRSEYEFEISLWGILVCYLPLGSISSLGLSLRGQIQQSIEPDPSEIPADHKRCGMWSFHPEWISKGIKADGPMVCILNLRSIPLLIRGAPIATAIKRGYLANIKGYLDKAIGECCKDIRLADEHLRISKTTENRWLIRSSNHWLNPLKNQ